MSGAPDGGSAGVENSTVAISPLINSTTSPAGLATAGERGRTAAKAGAPATPEAGSAAVTLSAASRSAGGQAGAQAGDIDLERVQQVVEAIREGRYSVDTSKIADGLIAGVRDLLK